MSNISRNIAKQTTLKARSRIVNHQTELATKAELKQWLRDNCPEALAGNTRASKDELAALVNEVKYGAGGRGGRFECSHGNCTHVVRNFVEPSGSCTIQGQHCEQCGSTDPEDLNGSDGYTTCCNELISWGPQDCRNHHGEK